MLSDNIYKKIANFTSFIIFCYGVVTIVVRPIAKHSFVLRAAKRLYTVNQEIKNDKTPVLLKPTKGQKHQENNYQPTNRIKRRSQSLPSSSSKKMKDNRDYHQNKSRENSVDSPTCQPSRYSRR